MQDVTFQGKEGLAEKLPLLEITGDERPRLRTYKNRLGEENPGVIKKRGDDLRVFLNLANPEKITRPKNFCFWLEGGIVRNQKQSQRN